MVSDYLTQPLRSEQKARAEREAREQAKRPILDTHCEHADLNHNKTRCLSCGLWLVVQP